MSSIKFKITIAQSKDQNIADQFISKHRILDINDFFFLVFIAGNEESAKNRLESILGHSHFFAQSIMLFMNGSHFKELEQPIQVNQALDL